jgi:O-antigen ligase
MLAAASATLRRAPRVAAPAGFAFAAAALGLLTGVNPVLGVGLAAAGAFTLIVMSDLALGVCGFLLITFLDVVSSGSDVSLTKAAGALLVVAWLAAVATRSGDGRSLVAQQGLLVAVLVAFLAWSALSAVWAQDPGAASRSTLRFALNAMLVPIVYWAVRDRRHVVWIFGVFVVGALLSVLWGLTQPKAAMSVSAAQAGRLTGATVEANVLATLLIVSTLFAGTLALVLRRAPVARVLFLVAATGGLAALFATFSRTGLVALAFALIVGIAYGGRWRPALVTLALLAAIVGTVYVSGTSSVAVTRLTSANSSGRVDLWTVGWRMVQANPVVGVGSGNYTIAESDYLLFPGAIRRGDFIVDKPLVAHNIYLHVLAEMGVIGLALFLSLLALCIASAVRAVAIFRDRGEHALEMLGRALVVALAAILAADFFVSEQYSKQLWLLLAMGPALLAIARRGAGTPTGARQPGGRLAP